MTTKRIGYIIGIIAGAAAFLFASLYIIHVTWAVEDGETYFYDALAKGWESLKESPFDIMPIPGNAMTYIFIMALLVFLIVWIAYQHHRFRIKTYDINKLKGRAKLMDEAELLEVKKTLAEPFGKKQTDGFDNIITTKEIRQSTDSFLTKMDLNTMVIGATNTGKSNNYLSPNLLQINCSYIITDPSGELYSARAAFLEGMGYKVKVFNISDMRNGHRYNPLHYVHTEQEVLSLVNMFIDNTSDPNKNSGDQFWVDAPRMLLNALISLVVIYGSPEDKNMSSVMDLLRAGKNKDGEEVIDRIFRMTIPESERDQSFTWHMYEAFSRAKEKTADSIFLSTTTRLQAFELPDVQDMTSDDEMELESIGDEKTAIFIVLPVTDNSFSYIALTMFSQLFKLVYEACEKSEEYSSLVKGRDKMGNEHVLKTFRAPNRFEMETAKRNAEKWLDKIRKTSQVEFNELTNLYEITTADGQIITFRRDVSDTNDALEMYRSAYVTDNLRDGRNGKYLPIHLRMILDEYKNLGGDTGGVISGFPRLISTTRKYNTSIAILLQSINQLKTMYKDEWGEIASNCSTLLFLGGNSDIDTFDFFSKLAGQQTRIAETRNEGSGASSSSRSISADGEALLSVEDMRLLKWDECFAILRGHNPYKGKKYKTQDHPNYEKSKAAGTYYFNRARSNYLIQKSRVQFKKEDKNAPVLAKTESAEINEKENEYTLRRKEDIQIGYDVTGAKIIGELEAVSTDNPNATNDVMDPEEVASGEYLTVNDPRFAVGQESEYENAWYGNAG